MELLKIVFETRSPTIVTSKMSKRGYCTPLDYIPPSTLRGALISSLYRSEIVDKDYLSREAESPNIVTSPAFPLDRGRESYPAHPFIYECKIPHEKNGQRFRERYNDGREILQTIKEGLDIKIRQLCSVGHPSLENLHPRLLIPLKESFEEVKLLTMHFVNTGVNKHRGTSHKGMLFEYEAIVEGVEFWSNISTPEEFVEVFKPGFEFSIGRGVSRGFGKAVIKDVKKINLDEEAEDFKKILENNRRIVFYSLSNLLSVRADNTASTYPSEIELRRIGERFNVNVGGRIIIEKVYGKMSAFHSGWDIRSNMERPIIRSASRGSIAIGRVSGTGELSKILAILSHIGTIEYGLDFNITGVNILVPLEIHPMAGW
ncbi:MAG: RAMP superfamily CRISPR-associated protein [Candidatus Caldarchaeales archaeon]